MLARGDADSFAEFYGRHARRLAGWLMRATGDAEAAADLTAETFAAALAARRRYPAPGRPPLPGFSAQAMGVPPTPRQEEYLVYGPVPEEAAAVELTRDGEVVERVETSEGRSARPATST